MHSFGTTNAPFSSTCFAKIIHKVLLYSLANAMEMIESLSVLTVLTPFEAYYVS